MTPTPEQERVREGAGYTPGEIVAPRLQLRWERSDKATFSMDGSPDWLCHYELVLPLRDTDIRRTIYDEDGEEIGERDELVVALKGPTIRGSSGKAPCSAQGFDTPFRDGAHAGWDSAVLGDLPIFVIAPDGSAHPEPYDVWQKRRADTGKARGE